MNLDVYLLDFWLLTINGNLFKLTNVDLYYNFGNTKLNYN